MKGKTLVRLLLGFGALGLIVLNSARAQLDGPPQGQGMPELSAEQKSKLEKAVQQCRSQTEDRDSFMACMDKKQKAILTPEQLAQMQKMREQSQ